MNETIDLLLKEAQGCLNLVEAYVSEKSVKVGTPSIKVADDELKQRTHEGVTYTDVLMTDDAFTNYIQGLNALGFNQDELTQFERSYNDLREQTARKYEMWQQTNLEQSREQGAIR